MPKALTDRHNKSGCSCSTKHGRHYQSWKGFLWHHWLLCRPSSDGKREKKREDDHFQLAQHSVDFRLASQTGKVGSIAFYIRAKLANKKDCTIWTKVTYMSNLCCYGQGNWMTLLPTEARISDDHLMSFFFSRFSIVLCFTKCVTGFSSRGEHFVRVQTLWLTRFLITDACF